MTINERRVGLMSYRMKELHLDDTVRVVFHEFKDAVGRAAPIIAVTRGALFDTFVLEMKPPLQNGNRAISIPEIHVKVL
jgi:hypothetical protein